MIRAEADDGATRAYPFVTKCQQKLFGHASHAGIEALANDVAASSYSLTTTNSTCRTHLEERKKKPGLPKDRTWSDHLLSRARSRGTARRNNQPLFPLFGHAARSQPTDSSSLDARATAPVLISPFLLFYLLAEPSRQATSPAANHPCRSSQEGPGASSQPLISGVSARSKRTQSRLAQPVMSCRDPMEREKKKTKEGAEAPQAPVGTSCLLRRVSLCPRAPSVPYQRLETLRIHLLLCTAAWWNYLVIDSFPPPPGDCGRGRRRLHTTASRLDSA